MQIRIAAALNLPSTRQQPRYGATSEKLFPINSTSTLHGLVQPGMRSRLRATYPYLLGATGHPQLLKDIIGMGHAKQQRITLARWNVENATARDCHERLTATGELEPTHGVAR